MSKSLKALIPRGHMTIKDNVLQHENLTGVSESKSLWAKDLDFPEAAETTFFAGCGYQHMKFIEGMMGALERTEKIGLGINKAVGVSKFLGKVGIDLTNITAKMTASKEDPYTPVLASSVSVLLKLGVEVAYLREKEPCCGSPLHYAGFEADYAEHARNSHKTLKSLGVKKLVAVVPGCTSALRGVYPEFVSDYDLEVEHILETVARRLRESAAKPRVAQKVTVVYHDPCQLSRYLGIIDEPREIIRSIEGVELIDLDPEQTGKWSTCCGGGGLEATHPDLSHRIGAKRAEELLKTGASIILSNCPACDMQLTKSVRQLGSDIKVIDLIRFLDNAL